MRLSNQEASLSVDTFLGRANVVPPPTPTTPNHHPPQLPSPTPKTYHKIMVLKEVIHTSTLHLL